MIYIFNYYDFSLNFVNLIFNINPESFILFWDIIFDKNITTKNLEIKKKKNIFNYFLGHI
jgi:hypothetical protein